VSNVTTGKIAALKTRTLKSALTGEVFSTSASITQNMGITDFRLTLECLPAGHRASSPHIHTKSDEIYLVLYGTPTLYIDDVAQEMSAGDYIILKAGGKEYHHLENHSEDKVELLQISACIQDDEIQYQPKVLQDG
jgi:uncharacterized cupin superfamily protein